jgi:2-keto-3-deoxy-6-phosphogluconate aldolase
VAKEAHMTLRFICPHCHSPLDPQTMDAASTAGARLCICPECDEPIVLAINAMPGHAAAPAVARLSENATQ